jgi:hypothetical protein
MEGIWRTFVDLLVGSGGILMMLAMVGMWVGAVVLLAYAARWLWHHASRLRGQRRTGRGESWTTISPEGEMRAIDRAEVSRRRARDRARAHAAPARGR